MENGVIWKRLTPEFRQNKYSKNIKDMTAVLLQQKPTACFNRLREGFDKSRPDSAGETETGTFVRTPKLQILCDRPPVDFSPRRDNPVVIDRQSPLHMI